jgi:hypothetical protein
MIISIYCEPDHRFSRLALMVARLRQRQSKSVALLDVTAALPSTRTGQSLMSRETISGIPVVRVRRSVETELSRLKALYQDVIIDSDDLSSPVGISGLVAARTTLIALYPHSLSEPDDRNRLIDRIERAWLFNPRLQVVMLAVCYGTAPSIAHISMLKSFEGTVPCIRRANDYIHDMYALHKSLAGESNDRASGEPLSWCSELFAAGA